MTGRDARPRRAGVLIASALMVTASLGACRAPEADGPKTSPLAVAASAASPALAAEAIQGIAPLPAPEYFETLTEEAFDATPTRLDAVIAQARAAASRDRAGLSVEAAAMLDRRLAEITTHRTSLNRADLALSSIEAFRLFVAAIPASEPVPAAVSLLDYAGFRYVADLKAGPARWADAVLAADFAEARWLEIESRVTDATLRRRFAESVTALKASATARDAAAAMRAGQRELDQVDELETFFARHPA